MTSNEDAEIRKHGYKPLKRRSPTPLYYPLTLQRGMLHTAAERETATEGDRGGRGRGPGEGDPGPGVGPAYGSQLGRALLTHLTTTYQATAST